MNIKNIRSKASFTISQSFLLMLFYYRCGYWPTLRNCYSDGVFEIIEQNCQNKSSCTVEASDDLYRDPCWGYDEYLYVEYACVEPKGKDLFGFIFVELLLAAAYCSTIA